jgi:hypothetical protein
MVHLPPQPGDANCDERLSVADALALAGVLGGDGDRCGLADVNCDDAVDDSDLVLLLNHLFDSRIPASCN